MVSGSAPRTITYSLYREREPGFAGLAADGVLHLHPDTVFAGADGLLEVDAHGGGDVARRVERLGTLGGGPGLGPEDFPARRDHGGDVGDVDLVLRAELVADDVEAGPHAVAGFVDRLVEGLIAILIAVKAEVANDERLAGLDRAAPDLEPHGQLGVGLGGDVFDFDDDLVGGRSGERRDGDGRVDFGHPLLVLQRDFGLQFVGVDLVERQPLGVERLDGVLEVDLLVLGLGEAADAALDPDGF